MANGTSPAETVADPQPSREIDAENRSAARTGVTLETPRNFCPYGGLVGGMESQWNARKGFMLHGRLKAMGALYVIVAGLAQARELFIDVGFSPLPALGILATMAAATAYLWWEQKPPLHKLRIFEVYFFAAPAAALVYIDWQLMVLSANSGVMLMNWYRLIVHMCLLIAGFAIFMPAGWRRTLIFTGAMGALPFMVLEVMRRRVPAVEAAMQEALTAEIYTGAIMLAAIMVAIAVFGTYVIDKMHYTTAEMGHAGQYHLEKKLGAGGMGEVWLARHKLLTRPAAIKVVRPEVVREAGMASGTGGSGGPGGPGGSGGSGGPGGAGGSGQSAGSGGSTAARSAAATAMKRFEREAQATASLTSPHTIDIYDFGVAMDGTFFYAMEYLDGLDLESLIADNGPVPVERAVHLLAQACDSLADAHEHGMIHRDIKPGNIFATRMGIQHDFVKVLDFGLVKETKPDQAATALTQEGMTSGTPAFMPPEIALGKADVDARADIYALGCVGYWLATGHYVFDADSPMGIVVEHVKSEPAAPSTRTEIAIPREFDDAILRALAKDPEVRFQSMREFADALLEVPVPQPWNQARASEWWQLRGRGNDGAAPAATVH